MPKTNSLVSTLALCASLGLALSACSSDGAVRVGAVGPAGPAGVPGPQGEQGEQGAPGRTTPGDATPSEVDDETSLGDAGMLAVGGMIGPNGVAGTGLLANTGDPDNMSQFQQELLRETGEEVVDFSVFFASAVEGTELEGNPLTGAVIGVLEDTGMTLVQNSEGDVYLVDGLIAAPGDLVDITIGQSELVGMDGADTLIAVSALSSENDMGELATIGAISGGDLANVDAGGLLDAIATGLNIDPIDVGGVLAGVVPDDQSLVTISEDSSFGITLVDDQLIDTDLDMVQTMSDTADAGGDMFSADGGDLGGALDGMADGGSPVGVLEPIMAGGGEDSLSAIVDPVVSSLDGDDLMSGLPIGQDDPNTQEFDLSNPDSGNGDLVGDTLEGVTEQTEDLLGGLLGGGE